MLAVDANDARWNPGRAVVHRQPGAARDRLELLERDLEPVRAGKRVRGDERVAAVDVAPLDARQVDGHPLPGLRALDGRVVHLHRADAHVAARRLEPQLIALADRPRPERARDDGADPAQREDAVDVQPRREVGAALLDRPRDLARARRAARRARRPLTPLTATTGAPGTSSRASSSASSSVSGSTASAFVTATTPCSTPRSRRIARCSCVCGRAPSAASITSRNRSMPVAPATIVRTKRSWPGTSTSDSARPLGQLERRVAEVDRDPARRLLGQPIRVLARERPDERRLAVVDVPGGADRQRHAEDVCRSSRPVTSAVSVRAPAAPRARPRRPRRPRACGVEQQAAVADDADDRGLAKPERRGERLLDRAGDARQLGERQRTAADARDRLLDLAADERRRGARPARAPSSGSSSMRSTGISRRARSGSASTASVPSSAASVSLSARSARCSGWRRSRSTSSARPTTIPACGPPSSLSPEKQTRSAPAARLAAAVGSSPSVEQRSPSRGRRRAGARLAARAPRARASDGCGEPDDPEVRLVDAQQRRRLGPDRVARSRPTLVRFVVPTSTMRAPERARTSGMRKPSPISTSSPRETTTSRPSASAASASSTAAALLLTTSAASAPVSRRERARRRDPGATRASPASRSSSRFE